MGYFSSTNVTVFPSVYRSLYPSGKFTNETNFSNIVRSIVDNDSYVIDYKNNTLEVIIYGYYFKIKNLRKADLPKYLVIRTENDIGGRGINLVDESGSTTLDYTGASTAEFRGLWTADAAPSGSGLHYLKVYNANKDDLCIKKFSSNSIYYAGDTTQNTSITQKIDSKQNEFTVYNDSAHTDRGLVYESGAGENGKDLLRITTFQMNKLKGLSDSGTNHSASSPILPYFNTNGVLQNSSASVGSGYGASANSGNVDKIDMIYLNNGTFKGNLRVYYSTENPKYISTSPQGSIWIKYKA